MRRTGGERPGETYQPPRNLRLLWSNRAGNIPGEQEHLQRATGYPTRPNVAVHRLVAAVQQSLRIREDARLISVLGDGSERSTEEALATWVRHNLTDLDSDAPQEILEELCRLLRREILELADRYWQPWDVPGD